uniref:Uncharacterized protein n=1 Tax=Oryza brachyantha TaxID=4533 RepID=J3MUI5_ORYBR
MESEGEEETSMSSSSSSRAPLLLLNPVYARSKSVIHDELRNFRVFLQWCALDHSSRAARAASYAAFLALALAILRFEGIYHMFDVEARASAAEIFAEHRRIRTQLLATSHRYRAFIISCLVTITVSQLSALLVALSSKDGKSFANSGDLLVQRHSHSSVAVSSLGSTRRSPSSPAAQVGSSVQLSGFFMCLLGAARITHRAQRIVSIASQWHMTMESVHHAKPAATSSSSASDMDALHPSAGAAPASHQPELGTTAAACAYRSRHALVTYLSHNSGGITLFGFTLDRGLLHTIFAFEMTLVLWILSKFVEFS